MALVIPALIFPIHFLQKKTKKAAAKFTDGNRRVSFILDKNTAQGKS